ncbi:hypothetical protein HDE_01604 [Halotydeus destructor]|nr:hypothetical protein HDE_01604 [Halotydeus destructor]
MVFWQLSSILLVLAVVSGKPAHNTTVTVIPTYGGILNRATKFFDYAVFGETRATLVYVFDDVIGQLAMTSPVELEAPKGEQRWTFDVIFSGVTCNVSGTISLAGEVFQLTPTGIEMDKLQYKMTYSKTGARRVTGNFEIQEHLIENMEVVSYSGIAKHDYLDKTNPLAVEGNEVLNKGFDLFFRAIFRNGLRSEVHTLSAEAHDHLLRSIS